jgi:hypothetical protein
MTNYWRIRLKNQDGDFTAAAWARGEIGIWYGGWSAVEFREACKQCQTNNEIADRLNSLPSQQRLIDNGSWDSRLGRRALGIRRQGLVGT